LFKQYYICTFKGTCVNYTIVRADFK